MRTFNIFLVPLLLISNATSNGVDKINPRAFRNRYTKTVVKPHVITSFVPSSCIQVDATLPPCRTLRSFDSFPSIERRSNSNDGYINITNLDTPQDPDVQTTPLSWGEYLGIYAPTVTVTSTQIITTTVVDPGVQVTYAIKGCRPKVLPLSMDRCAVSELEDDSINISPTSVISTIQPTSVSSPQVTEFNAINVFSSTESVTLNTERDATIQLEGSGSTSEQDALFSRETPTEGLDKVVTVKS